LDAAGTQGAAGETSEECLSDCANRREFCERASCDRSGGNPPALAAGKEVGRPFLLTLLWRNKRVRRRAGPLPRDPDLIPIPKSNIKTGGGARQHLHFLWIAKENEAKENDPNAPA